MKKLMIVTLLTLTGCSEFRYSVEPNAVDPRNDGKIASECVTVYEKKGSVNGLGKEIGEYCKSSK